MHGLTGPRTASWCLDALQGVFIANQMVSRTPSPSSDSSDEDYYDIADATAEPLLETRITFNGGQAPAATCHRSPP